MNKPFSEACERNREPILAVLRDAFAGSRAVLEIGAGTGQHAVYFAQHLPHLVWQPTDRAVHLPGIRAWCDEAALQNLLPPRALDVMQAGWGMANAQAFDAVFTANTLHIMSWAAMEAFFAGMGRVLPSGGVLAVYGPFNIDGRYTAPSNAQFDAWLKARDPQSGIRDREAVDALGQREGLVRTGDHSMPANNRLVVWRRKSAPHG